MNVTFVILILILACFSFILLFGAPYLPTLKSQKIEALDLLDLKPGQIMLELGCGDGRVLKEAAKRKIKGIGYELNPLLYLLAKIITFNQRDLVTIKWANYWTISWPKIDGIYVFLIAKYMAKLDTKIIQSGSQGVKLVSYSFKIPGKKAIKSKNGLYLYKY